MSILTERVEHTNDHIIKTWGQNYEDYFFSEANAYSRLVMTEITPECVINMAKRQLTVKKFGVNMQASSFLNETQRRVVGKNLYDRVVLMYEHGVSNRDLHTKNILIDPSTLEVKIIDFELAGFDLSWSYDLYGPKDGTGIPLEHSKRNIAISWDSTSVGVSVKDWTGMSVSDFVV